MRVSDRYIVSADSLITTHEEIRAVFLAISLEKKRIADLSICRNALVFRQYFLIHDLLMSFLIFLRYIHFW